jgi:hypothetical protein
MAGDRRRTDDAAALARAPDATGLLRDRDLDLPVVARMMIEIRSDGTRTVARGAVEDVATGQQVAVIARGASPLALAADLTRSVARGLTALPFAATSAVVRRLLRRG